MAITAQVPFCTWGCFSFLKEPHPSLLPFLHGCWHEIGYDACRVQHDVCNQNQPCMTVSGPERKGGNCKEDIRIFEASLCVSTEFKFCLPSPHCLESITTEKPPGNRGQWLDTYWTCCNFVCSKLLTSNIYWETDFHSCSYSDGC